MVLADLWQIWPWPICRSFPGPVLPAEKRLLRCEAGRGGWCWSNPSSRWGKARVRQRAAWWRDPVAHADALEAVIIAAAAQDWLAAGLAWPHRSLVGWQP